MNLLLTSGASCSALTQESITFADFNQDFSSFIIGTKHGFAIFACDASLKCYYRENDFPTAICRMLYNSSLVAITGAGENFKSSPRKLRIINTKRQSVVCEFNYPTTILNVLLNRKRLVTVLESKIHIYELSTMKIIQTLETLPNVEGISALSDDPAMPLLAYPADAEQGIVEIFDCGSLTSRLKIKAHRNALRAVAFSHDGSILATVSSKGTIIRIFDTRTGERLCQYRRGSYPARVTYLSFSHPDSSLLLAISHTATVHIFRVEKSSGPGLNIGPPKGEGSGYSISERIQDSLECKRDFASIKLPCSNLDAVGAITITSDPSSGAKLAYIRVLTSESSYFYYSLDTIKGGEAKLINRLEVDLSNWRETTSEAASKSVTSENL